MAKPTLTHINAAKHLLNYIKGSPEKGIILSKIQDSQLLLLLMQTEVHGQILVNQSSDFVCFLETLSFPGNERSNR